MNASIISWTNETKSCLSRFSDEIFIKSVAEKHYQYWSNTDHDFKICSIDNAIYEYKIHELDKFIIPCLLRGNTLNAISIYLLLKSYEIPDNDILYVPYNVIKSDKIIFVSDLTIFIERKELDRLELHINDHCNLRCANCSMLAGLVHNEVNVDFELTKFSLFKLHNIFNHILEIDIFGGEPLLNDEITKYCILLRIYFPYSFIEIITNGTLILNLNNEFFKTCYKYNIVLSISYYPVLSSYIDDINFILSKNKIVYTISERITSFEKYYDFSGKSNLNQTYTNCQSVQYCKNGLTLYEDMLFSCVAPITLKRANVIHDSNKYGIKVSNSLSRNEIKSLFQPMEICKYCHIDQLQKWKQLNINEIHDIENWSV